MVRGARRPLLMGVLAEIGRLNRVWRLVVELGILCRGGMYEQTHSLRYISLPVRCRQEQRGQWRVLRGTRHCRGQYGAHRQPNGEEKTDKDNEGALPSHIIRRE